MKKTKIGFFLVVIFLNLQLMIFAQEKSIVLGRPTDNSITLSLLFDENTDYFIEYGTQTENYPFKTTTYQGTANTPDELDLIDLAGNTRYYYVLNYKVKSSSNYSKTPEYSFTTQRAKGSEFSFTMEADEHLYDKKGVRSLYKVCLANQAKDKPDFMLSIGDIFGDDHNPYDITSYEVDTLHRHYRPLLGDICHSVPFYVCLGNHEGEMDYYLNKSPGSNLALWATLWRKFYFPNPYPNNFYSGNTEQEPFSVGNPENYYAWTWGDAQFIVLDAYRDQSDTSAKPKGWEWSLGKPQYDWLRQTLETSTSKYKFVIAHHINGQGRGGITNAKLHEWGGYESAKGKYTFDQNRPGWGKPIHQLFVDNGVNIFFQGHDHVFAHEVLDGVVYQALPMPSDSTYEIGMLANADAYTADTIGGSGHLRVTVNESCVKVDFVRAYLPADTQSGAHTNGEVAFSYTLGTCALANTEELKGNTAIQVNPNPAKDQLVIQTNGEQISNVTIMNSSGQEVIKGSSNELDVRNLDNGIYLVKIETLSNVVLKKVAIQH